MGPLVEALRSAGASITPVGRDGFLPLRVEGRTLRGGPVRIRGDVSSQFLSALLLASPLVPGGLELDVAGPLASASYLDMTRRTISAFSRGPARFAVPGDDSAACFPIAGAVASGGRVELLGLFSEPEQPDAVFRRWAREAGAEVSFSGTAEGSVLVVDASGPGAVRGLEADVDAAPDAALPLAAMLAFAGGTSTLTGVARLREKESDRLAAAVELLSEAGAAARVENRPSGAALVIDGPLGKARRGSFASRDDHRVAMSAAVLALTLPAGSELDDPAVVSKSYPEFFADWERLTASGR
jgi:3-phosphoshikimate 1-carboxyvinyltransferase